MWFIAVGASCVVPGSWAEVSGVGCIKYVSSDDLECCELVCLVASSQDSGCEVWEGKQQGFSKGCV